MSTAAHAPLVGVHTPPDRDREARGRHPWLGGLCARLADIAVGVAARDLLTGGALPDHGAVVVLPTWAWALPGIDVGRKGIGYDRVPVRLPVRLSYSCGPVLLVARDEQREVSWHGTGMGRTDSGTITVGELTDGPLADDLADWDAELPSEVLVTSGPSDSLHTQLTHLVQTGEASRWELLGDLESKYVTKEMTAAAGRVVAEITDGASGGLDPVIIETLVARFVYGDPGQENAAPLARLITHALTPSQFTRVDPGRWLTVALRRDAERFIRRYLGDPGVGPKVRRVARETGHSSLDKLVAAYQELHPSDRVAHRRATAALSTCVDPLLVNRPLDTSDRGVAS